MNPFQNTTGPSQKSRERQLRVLSVVQAGRESTIQRLTAEIASAQECTKHHAEMARFYRSLARTKAQQVRDLVASRG